MYSNSRKKLWNIKRYTEDLNKCRICSWKESLNFFKKSEFPPNWPTKLMEFQSKYQEIFVKYESWFWHFYGKARISKELSNKMRELGQPDIGEVITIKIVLFWHSEGQMTEILMETWYMTEVAMLISREILYWD